MVSPLAAGRPGRALNERSGTVLSLRPHPGGRRRVSLSKAGGRGRGWARRRRRQPREGTGLNVLTWHVHGSYLYYLARVPVDLYLPVRPGRPEGYGGRSGSFRWPPNVHEVPAEAVRGLDLDCVLYQSRRNYLLDADEILSPVQRRLPAIYLEHDPPREHPTDTRHPAGPEVLLVHVTGFNELMWDAGRTPTRVIPHGVVVPAGLRYAGDLPRGLAVVNNIAARGRRTGADVLERLRAEVPVDLAGMGSEELGGLGDVPLERLHALEVRYRFFLNPIRYTSMGLAVCEAMMLGLPVVGLATTEMAVAVENGRSGWVDTDLDRLADVMRELIRDPAEARRLGARARKRALELFGIERFAAAWLDAFEEVTGRRAGDRRPAREVVA